MNTVFLDADTVKDCDLSGLKEICQPLTIYDATSPEETASRLSQAEVVIVNKVLLTREILAAAESLKLICVIATGTNNVDLTAAKELGIEVRNCQGYGTASVVQHVFTLMLALQTNLLHYHNAVQQGRWQQSSQFCFLDYPISELKGKTLGIIGYGNLGQGVEEIAKAFGMRVLVAARPGQSAPNRTPFEEVLQLADVLSLHCPLTEQTKNLIGKAELEQMKSSAILINAARGGIVDEKALLNALETGEIAGAATDVLVTEPPTDGNPLLDANLPNLIITPHIAWGSKESRQRIVAQTVENIEAFVSGQSLRQV